MRKPDGLATMAQLSLRSAIERWPVNAPFEQDLEPMVSNMIGRSLAKAAAFPVGQVGDWAAFR